MPNTSYEAKKADLTTYFDRTAAAQWEALTSDAPVGRIRATVRAGRDTMRAALMDRLPADMSGLTLLDAGCGTGALALEAAARGAEVTAIDISPRMVEIARDRAQGMPGATRIAFHSGDMLADDLGRFDHVVAMDSLIHYARADLIAALVRLVPRIERSILFTIAPRTPLLAAMHSAGKLFPRANRSPAIQPVPPAALEKALSREPGLAGWRHTHSKRIAGGFYISQAQELTRI